MSSSYQDFHTASSLARRVEQSKVAAEVTATDRQALADPGKRYGLENYEPLPPASRARSEATFDVVLDARRSTRDFADRPVPLEQIGAVLSAYRCSGQLDLPVGPLPLRTAASAGGLYPIEVYLVATRVAGLATGVYHYRPAEVAITATRLDSAISKTLESLVLDPQQATQAAGALILTARFDRSTHKYGDRGYRYILIEAGGIAQTFSLAAAATDTGLVCHGAFYDSPANRLLGIDGLAESVVVILLFGTPA